MTPLGSRAGTYLGAAAGGALAWGWFEAGWVRLRTLDVGLPGLPEELVGLRIAHLSDFHLGLPSRGIRAVEAAVDWVAERRPDLVAITGDLVSRPGAAPRLRELLGRLGVSFSVLGNHDVEQTRDPFSRAAGLGDLSPSRLLVDEAVTVEVRDRRIQIVGVDPRSYKRKRSEPWQLADPEADLRILLCHFPTVLRRTPDRAFQQIADLVLQNAVGSRIAYL